jgi:Flp pilus assembly protein TadD
MKFAKSLQTPRARFAAGRQLRRLLTPLLAVGLGWTLGCDPAPPRGPDPMLIADPAPTDDGQAPGAGLSDLDKGKAYVEKEAYDKALPHLEKALEVKPDNAEAHYLRALALLKTGKQAEAEKGFVKALELDGDLTHARVHLGAIYLAEPPRPKEAIAVLEPAAAKEPDAVDIRDLLAFAYRLQGANDKAAKQYEKALSIKATPQLHFAYSDLLFEMKKNDAATAHLKSALPGYEKDPQQLAAIADRFGQLQAFDECVSTFDKVLALDARQPSALVKRGLCKHGQKKEKDAQTDYFNALKIDPGFQAAHYYLGMSFLANKMRGKGVTHLEKAVKAKPDSPVGKRAQAKLDELNGKK